MEKRVYSVRLMSIFDKLLNKRTITSPIFLKKFENDNRQLQDLNDLLEKVRSDKKNLINGDIFIAAVDIEGNATVKTYKTMGGKILLMPENYAYEPFMLDEGQFSIIGVAVGIIKN